MAPSEYQATTRLYCSLTKHGGCGWQAKVFRLTRGTKIEKSKIGPEPEERSLTGDFNTDSKWGSSYGDLPRSEALQRATGQNPSVLGTGEILTSRGEHLSSSRDNTGNLEVLREKVGTLDIQGVKGIVVVLSKR
jgi:hypothetical protein